MAERTNPHANLIIGAQDEASPVFDKIKASSQSMAAGVEQAAAKAAGAVGGVGDKAAPAAQKLDGITASMIRQVQRLNAELEAGGARNAAYFEKMASVKGADLSAMAPYLADLKKAEAAQRVATTGLDQMGMSAKQTTAALRQVPMQFTDIVVSLQGGQSAMQVFLQQGGQLKDMFGGAGNAARALGGYVIGLVNPFTVAAAAVAGFGLAMASVNSKDAALLALSTQLAATGRASAGAVGEIKALVKELNLIPGVSKASATAIITEFAKVNGIGSDLFKSLGSSVADFAAATGTDLPTAAKKLADAFADPAKGAQVLEGALGTLTAAQILTIEKMAAMGDKSGAQVAMMDALKQATEGLAKQGMTPLGEATDKMSNAWDALTSSIGNSEAFRTANSWLAALIEKVAELTVGLSQMKPPTWLQYLPVAGPAIGALRMASGTGAGSRSVSGVVGTWDEGGATGSWGPTASETEQQVKAAIAATRGYETQSAAMEKLRGVASQAKDALKELESQNRGGSVEAMRLRDSIAAMNEKLADMGKKGAPKGPTKETISEYDKLIKKLSDELPRAAAEAEAAQMGYNKAQTEFLALAGSPAWASFSNSQRAVVASMFEGKIASEEAGEAAKALSKSYAEAAAERIKTIQSMERAADSLQSQNDALREEIELIGLSTEQQTLVLQQRNDVIILTKEASLAELERQSAITGTQTRVEIALASEIEALKERNALLGAKGVKNAAVDAAKSAADEWQKTTDSINQSLTDSLLRGFESGKDFAKNLRDTVINMFQTMVLRPTISAILAPVAGGVTGLLGLSGAANAGQGAGSLMGMASNASSAYNLVSGGLNVASQAGTWLSGKGTELALQYMGESAGTLLNNFALGMSSTSSMSAASAALQGVGADIAGLAVGSVLNGFSGYGISSALSGGYSAGGWVNTAAGIASMIPGVGPIAGVVGGAVNRVFGRKHTQTNLQGTFGGENGFEGRYEDYYKGGWLRSGKSVYTPLEEETRSALADQYNAMRASTAVMAQTLGLGTDAIDSFTASVNIKLKGLSAEEAQAAIQAEYDKIAQSLASATLGTDAYTRAGETSVDTLTRLSGTLVSVNSIFDQLGFTLYNSSLLGADAAGAFADRFGGVEGLNTVASSYYENFYREAEKTAAVTRSVSESLAQVGLAMPATRDEFRALVESQLALGESGAEAVAALLGVSGAFAALTPTIDAMVASVGINAQQISATLRDGLLGRISGEEMGASIGTMITNGIQNAIAGGFADQITQVFMQGIVNPVIQAAMTGSSISAAVSQASIDAMVQQAQAAATAIGAILNDPGFQSAMAQIQAAIGSFTTASSVGYRAPVLSGGGGGYDSGSYSDSVEAVDDAWRDLLQSIVESTLAAQTELSRLGMTSYERALAEIQDNAQARLKEMLGGGYMSDTMQTRDRNVLRLAQQESLKSTYTAREASGRWLRPGWESAIDASIAALKTSIAGLNEELAKMPPEIQELIAAETALLEARNALQAGEIVGNLQTEIDRLGMSDLERTLAGISDRADDYIKSLQDLGQATDANIGVVGEWEDAMRLDAIKKAWAGVTDSILGEIDRIRGSLSGDGGLAALQAEFAIKTASARAGDTEAGGTLAKLSSDILRLSEGTAGSAFEWARMQAQMLASLQETARIASLMGGGVSAAISDAPSQTYEIPTPYMPRVSQQGAGNAELIAEIRLLNRRLETLEANTQATALHTQKTSKALERAMPNGDAIATREMA